MALTGMAVALIDAHHPGVPLALLVPLALGLGLLLGAVNGALVWRLGIPPIVVTLGTLAIFRGLAFVLSGGAWINSFQFTPAFLAVPRAEVLGVPVLSWAAVAVVAIAWTVFGRTGVGRSWYAVGGNPTAAVYAGIDAGRPLLDQALAAGEDHVARAGKGSFERERGVVGDGETGRLVEPHLRR